MQEALKVAADGVLREVAGRKNGLTGVVAVATDRQANFYDG